MPYIIEHTYTIRPGDVKSFTSFYQYSLTGNHMDGGNVFGAKDSAKKFESKVKAQRIAREMHRMRKEAFNVIEI